MNAGCGTPGAMLGLLASRTPYAQSTHRMFALLSQLSNQLESRYEKEALAVSGIGHPPSHYNSAGDLEDRC
jgi:hypothetical protein